MFGTYEKFNLLRPPYGREGSGFYLYEDFYTRLLRLSCFKSGEMVNHSAFQFDLMLFDKSGAGQTYTYFADEGSLRLDCPAGYAEIALTDQDHLRIRGTAELRLCLRPAVPQDGTSACRGLHPLPNGEWEGAFGKFGLLRLRSLAGEMAVIAPWNPQKGLYDEVIFVFKSADGAPYEAAIFETMEEFGTLPEALPPFDEVVAENRRSFERFKQNYRPVPERYREIANYAMWLLWTHRTKTIGGFKEPMILMHLQWLIAAVSWQQTYNAMATLNNPKEAWRLFCTMFEHQDPENGALSFAVDYFGGGKSASPQPPFQGFGFAFLYDRFGDEWLDPAECERMYPKLEKWLNFWLTRRNAGRGDDVTAVLSTHESGWDDATIFKDGFPAANPDVMSFVALLMECLAKVGAKCGRHAEAAEWAARSKKLIDTIVSEFWDGEKFVTKVNGKPVDSMSAVCYEPIMLGRRLPQHVIDKVAEKLMDETTFLSPFGICGESMKSPLSGYGNRFIMGRVVAPINMILSVGLCMAGKKKEAAEIARRFCDHIAKEGVILGFAPFDYYPLTGEKVPDLEQFQYRPVASDGWPWSGWSACSVMTMLSYVIPEWEKEEAGA